ncbi:MAG: uracil-DNA glycosylase [Gammaproteobacteria bacterium]|nr:uracil-DNA glycosylase [Gammaproteobacteria bacterium]
MKQSAGLNFDLSCTQCKRLATFLKQVKQDHPDYHALPVPSFGHADAKFLIVGLAPGMHGANATGRPFTGDHAGILLYEMLYQHGFSSKPESLSLTDGLVLKNCRITNAVKCLPPQNKPLTDEIKNCNHFLANELAALQPGSVVLALGKIAHDAVIKSQGLILSANPFIHARQHQISDVFTLIDSYHCSRYNTNTKRLTTDMFDQIFSSVRMLLNAHEK